MDLWVGDGEAATGADVVQRVPISSSNVSRGQAIALLYGGVVGGKPAILRVTPGQNTPEDVVLEALAPAATSDGAPSCSCRRPPTTPWTSGPRMRTVAGRPGWLPR